MTWLVIGEEYLELSAREYPSVTPLPDSRVESGWVVSVGVEHADLPEREPVASPDTTHHFGSPK